MPGALSGRHQESDEKVFVLARKNRCYRFPYQRRAIRLSDGAVKKRVEQTLGDARPAPPLYGDPACNEAEATALLRR
jgi:hypothetical protein